MALALARAEEEDAEKEYSNHIGYPPSLLPVSFHDLQSWHSAPALDDVDSDYSDDDGLDPDSMSYEQLLELGEKIGNVKTGLSTFELSKLPVHVCKSGQIAENSSCSVCQEEYKLGDKVRTLPCFHAYHLQCIDSWLKDKNSCPICLKPAVEKKKKPKR